MTDLLPSASERWKPSPEQAETNGFLHFSGLMTSADVLQNFIVVRSNETLFTLQVPEENTREIARLFLGDVVAVEAVKNLMGNTVLEGIKRVA